MIAHLVALIASVRHFHGAGGHRGLMCMFRPVTAPRGYRGCF